VSGMQGLYVVDLTDPLYLPESITWCRKYLSWSMVRRTATEAAMTPWVQHKQIRRRIGAVGADVVERPSTEFPLAPDVVALDSHRER
jgi:hypothetical protein